MDQLLAMDQLVAVENRLSRLERENRRLKLAGVAMLVGFVGMFAGGAAFNQIPDQIVARRVVVVGPNNDPRVTLFVNDDGGAGMSLSRADNRGQAALVGSNPKKGGAGEVVTFDPNGVQTFRAP
jgi:hypothetical protein